MNRHHCLARLGFVQQAAHPQALRLPRIEQRQHRRDGVAAVDDVFDQQYVAIGDVDGQVHGDAHLPAGFPGAGAVRRDRHEVDGVRNGDVANQVAEEHDAAAQDADQQQVIVLVIAADLLAQFADALLQLLFGDEDFGKQFFIGCDLCHGLLLR